jgi:hypothetical protein
VTGSRTEVGGVRRDFRIGSFGEGDKTKLVRSRQVIEGVVDLADSLPINVLTDQCEIDIGAASVSAFGTRSKEHRLLYLGKAREHPSDLRHRLIRKIVLRVLGGVVGGVIAGIKALC